MRFRRHFARRGVLDITEEWTGGSRNWEFGIAEVGRRGVITMPVYLFIFRVRQCPFDAIELSAKDEPPQKHASRSITQSSSQNAGRTLPSIGGGDA